MADKKPNEANPPGEFLSEDLRDDTTRFLNEVKRQVSRRKQPEKHPRLGPPKLPNRK